MRIAYASMRISPFCPFKRVQAIVDWADGHCAGLAETAERRLAHRSPRDRRLRVWIALERTALLRGTGLRGHFRIAEMASNFGEYEGMYPLIL